MFNILVKGKPMQCTDGTVYKFRTAKEAVYTVNICYGISSFKNGVKINRHNDKKDIPLTD